MTFRAKPAVKRSHRPAWQSGERRSLYLNLGFGTVIVVAVLILVGAAAASWYGDHFGEVARVNGVSITRDDFRNRLAVERWRSDYTERRIRDAAQAGRMTEAERDQLIALLQQQRQQLASIVYERLIDAALQAQLAEREGVAVSEADIDARLVEEATRPEERHAFLIAVAPELDEGASEPTEAQRAAARAKAEAALAEIRAGTRFEDVARTTSTDASAAKGGDIGWIQKEGGLDEAFVDALFALGPNETTGVVEGADGVFRIGRVTEIAPAEVDDTYEQQIVNDGIGLDVYRAVVRSDVIRRKLEDRLLAELVEAPSVMRRVSEIYIAAAQHVGGGDEVKVRHILYAPKDDPQGAAALDPDDPAWAAAEAEARATYERLKALAGDATKLTEEFVATAKRESDEPGAETSGGELPYYTQGDLDRAFGDAIFAPGLEPGQLLEPVKSQFGWHVIQFIDRRGNAQSRAEDAKVRTLRGEDFAAIAKEVSEGPEAEKGGELGWVARYQFGPQLDAAIFGIPVGGVSDVIDVAGDGFYIFKVWEEQTRSPDPAQAKTLRRTAFSNWYAAEKEKATIDRSGLANLPTS
jgi:parvulin-like peptidyl-prolyl isomerase